MKAGGRWRLPATSMFFRILLANLALLVIAIASLTVLVTAEQNRAAADALAPIWVAAIEAQGREGQHSSRKTWRVDSTVELHQGMPPADAHAPGAASRSRELVAALERAGLDAMGIAIIDVLLDDRADPPVNWLQLRAADYTVRWIGVSGGLQPSAYRRRALIALGVMIALIIGTAWWLSVWLARPLVQLTRQVPAFGRGEMPAPVVGGGREIQRLSAALRSMAEQRAAFESQRHLMLMGVSHDLRSPLTRVRLAAELLDGQAAALRDRIVRNVEQADSIIESFLAYVRAEAEPVDARVDLAALTRSTADAASVPVSQVSIEPPVSVRGNATLLLRLLGNLLDNAERHGALPLRVTLRADATTNTATLAVEDSGDGIAEPERVLRPFERGDAARSTQGAGLGLAIVARIVERHAGQLAIERSDLGGARIVVRLPLSD